MVFPAAVVAVALYILTGHSEYTGVVSTAASWKDIILTIPYILVLLLALAGFNVMVLLFFGVVFSCILGVMTGAFDIWGALDACGKGTLGMSETLIVAILAGGLLKLIRWNGGIAYLMEKIRKLIRSGADCEIGVFALVSLVNFFTANNTVAIVIAGPIAKELSDRYKCEPRRIASILDTASCFVQGLIPYGAQMLIAVGIARSSGLKISTLSLLGTQYYQWLILLALLVTFGIRQYKSRSQKALS
jgi:Na+/H+ antiporter NhaC